jgi:L-lactate dehydrogenase complex protein LldG
MIPAFVEGLRANDCEVTGPLAVEDARRLLVHYARGTVALNGDVPIAGLADEFGDVLLPDAPDWRTRLPDADIGVTGARVAVVDPATIALAATPGSPRATSLIPPVHVCVVRVGDVVPTLGDALARLAADDLPSALTWIGGPSRTGDLEMILTLGVHGPRRVEVVLIAPD